jgi:curved DNA-binding protein CbpA
MSLADIKRVYTELAKIYHPDTGKVKNDTKFKEINEAFEQIRKMKK